MNKQIKHFFIRLILATSFLPALFGVAVVSICYFQGDALLYGSSFPDKELIIENSLKDPEGQIRHALGKLEETIAMVSKLAKVSLGFGLFVAFFPIVQRQLKSTNVPA